MPIKLKKSQKVKNRLTGAIEVQHFYIKTIANKELEDLIESPNTKSKIKQKCRNELIRRKV